MLSNRSRSWILTLAVALVGVLALWWANAALSQGEVTSQLTYQGTLFEGDQPVTGTRDMVFRLYSDDLCSAQLGPDIVRNGVAVEDGFFTVFLDVNPALFDGRALWIQATVGGTAFACQAILPAPYALSLRPGAVIRGSPGSTDGLLELDNQGPGQAIRVTSTEGMALYGSTSGGPAVYGYAAGGYGLRGVSSASGMAAVRGDTNTANTLGGDFYSAQSSGVNGVTASTVATPVPGQRGSFVAGVRGVGQSGGQVYGIYGESQAGSNGAGVYATNSGSGALAPDLVLGARNAAAGSGFENGVLSSDPLESSSNLVLLSNDDIWLYLDSDFSFENSQFEIRDRLGAAVFSVDDTGNTVAQGTVSGEDGLRAGSTSDDGLYVHQAGAYGSTGTSNTVNGIEVRSASNDGLMVGANGGDGVDIWNAGTHGLFVRNSGQHGLYIQNAGQNGVDIDLVGDYGINVADGRNYLADDTGIGTDNPTNRLHVRDSISAAASTGNHVALIENASTGGSADVLVIKINETGSEIGTENNYISFHDATGASLGAIQGNGAGGVEYAGAGNDYAEYLPRLDSEERIRPGDVVGLFAGQVSRRTAGADLVMAASTGPIVAGNDPGEDKRQDYSLIAFIGQVNVHVRGPVAAGDLLLPSGLNDGTAIALSPDAISIDQLDQIIGQAWESNADLGVKQVRTLVGLVQPAAFSAALQSVDARLDALEQALGPATPGAADGQSRSQE